MVLKSIAGVQVSGWVSTLPSPTPLGPLAGATVGGKRRGERSIQMPLFVSQLSFQCSLRAGCSAMVPDLCPSSRPGKADGEGKAPWEEALPSKACYPFPSTYRFLQGADKDRHFAYSETGFSSFYPLPHHSLGFALFWDLSKKINTTSPNLSGAAKAASHHEHPAHTHPQPFCSSKRVHDIASRAPRYFWLRAAVDIAVPFSIC